MTVAGLEPAIFGSDDKAKGPLVALRLAQQGAGQSFGVNPDMSVLEP